MLLVGMQISAATAQNSMEFPQTSYKWNCLMTPHTTSRNIPKETQTTNLKNLCTPLFIAALFTIAEIWKQPECPSVDEWIKKPWYIYTIKYYTAVKKKET